MGDRGLGDDAQRRGRDRHAQLADRQHERDVPQGEEGSAGSTRPLVGERLDLRAARRGDGELAGHEERIDGQQGNGDGETDSDAHSDTSSSSPPVGAGVMATCATRLPCIWVTSMPMPSTLTREPTDGISPSSFMTRPPIVS